MIDIIPFPLSSPVDTYRCMQRHRFQLSHPNYILMVCRYSINRCPLNIPSVYIIVSGWNASGVSSQAADLRFNKLQHYQLVGASPWEPPALLTTLYYHFPLVLWSTDSPCVAMWPHNHKDLALISISCELSGVSLPCAILLKSSISWHEWTLSHSVDHHLMEFKKQVGQEEWQTDRQTICSWLDCTKRQGWY